MGWVTVAAYLAVAVLCGAVARRGHLVWFWGGLAVVLVLLGINKQLDLQSLGTQMARDLARQQGWYARRRGVQQVFVLGVLATGVVFLGAMTYLLRGTWKRTGLALFGLVFLFAFVLIRAASFNRVDMLIGVQIGGLKMNWILELGSLLLIGLGAAWNLRDHGARRLAAWIVVGLGLLSGTACGGQGEVPAREAPRLGQATLAVLPGKDTPPFVLLLLEMDAAYPKTLEDLRPWSHAGLTFPGAVFRLGHGQ